jgi:hypothetical protein
LRLILLAALAWNGLYDLDLFALHFDQMADEDEPLVAGMGTHPLERSVVRLYGVVIVVMGCTLSVSTVANPFCGPGSGVLLAPPGPSLYDTLLYQTSLDKSSIL